MTTTPHPLARRTGRVVVAVLTAALVGVAATGCGSTSQASDAPPTNTSPTPAGHAKGLPAALAQDGTTVVVGRPDAPHTVRISVDPQCGYCAKFETGGGEAVAKAVRSGKVKAEYTIASFLDRGETAGSTRAANALRAALEEGKFAEFQEAVFTAQGTEEAQGFSNAYLLQLASQVKGLRGEAFDKAVNDLSYKGWVEQSLKAFQASGETSVPSVLLDGKKVEDGDALFNAPDFAALLEKGGAA
ncbi:thioredoxin domain-containing protein [Streptomyces sp. NPDC087440]|uniref:DsbA family protein n=1 Tax=Streptomyces sp. NPDC087440 TaxID=3365790 RepID=UPI0037F2A31B